VCLGVCAGGTLLGRLGALVDVAAVEAAPLDGLILLEDGSGLDVRHEAAVASLVLALCDGDGASKTFAISSKPSSRAVLANEGYMSVHS